MLVPVSVPPAAARIRRHDALSEMRRKEILKAATKVFGRKGFEATRADDIAAAAKIAKGTLYLYFKSKEAIYTAAVTCAVRELEVELARRSEGMEGFRAKLTTAVRVRLEFWPEHEAIYRLLLTVGREVKHRKQTNEVLQRAQCGILALFQEGVQSGEIEPGDFAPLAWAVLDMIRGTNERRMDRLSATTVQQDTAWITEAVFRHVKSKSASA